MAEKNGQPVTPRSTKPGLDNRDVFRAKNRPGTPGRSDCSRRRRRRRVHSSRRRAHSAENERVAATAGHAEVNGGARFFGPESVRRGCRSLDTSFDALAARGTVTTPHV